MSIGYCWSVLNKDDNKLKRKYTLKGVENIYQNLKRVKNNSF